MAIRYYNINHETLGSAVTEALRYLVDMKAILNDEEDIRSRFSSGMVYGQTIEAHGSLSSNKGKSTKVYAHVTVYRRETGTYELTVYIL